MYFKTWCDLLSRGSCIHQILMLSVRWLHGPYLQVAGGRCVVDLDVGGVSVRQLGPISQPNNKDIAGMSQDFTADVGRVALPRVHSYWALDFWGICDERQSAYKWKQTNPLVELTLNLPVGRLSPLWANKPPLPSTLMFLFRRLGGKRSNCSWFTESPALNFLNATEIYAWTCLFHSMRKSQWCFLSKQSLWTTEARCFRDRHDWAHDPSLTVCEQLQALRDASVVLTFIRASDVISPISTMLVPTQEKHAREACIFTA